MTSEEKPQDVEIPDHFDIKYLEMSDGAKLRYLSYHPDNPKGHVLMYPGMNTLVLSWIVILEKLSALNYAIDYIESREKHTSILPKDNMIDRKRMLDDCVEAIRILGLKEKPYIAIGSSLGSTTLIHTMAEGRVEPKHAILVGPSTEFITPLVFRLLFPFINHFTYDKFAKIILKKLALRKYTNEDADPKQKRKYALALELANPVKLKTAARKWHGNSVFDDLSKIDGEKTNCILIGASEDILHPDEETRKVAEGIENSQFVDLKTNTAAHDQPLIDLIESLD